MDKLDIKILDSLKSDSRKSFRDVAKEVDSTPATVISRVEKMERIGIIRGYTTNLNYEKLNYTTTALISLEIDGKSGLKKIGDDFQNNPNIVLMYETAGETDVVLLVKFKTQAELKNLRDEILNKDYVKKSTTSYVEHIYKEGLNLPI